MSTTDPSTPSPEFNNNYNQAKIHTEGSYGVGALRGLTFKDVAEFSSKSKWYGKAWVNVKLLLTAKGVITDKNYTKIRNAAAASETDLLKTLSTVIETNEQKKNISGNDQLAEKKQFHASLTPSNTNAPKVQDVASEGTTPFPSSKEPLPLLGKSPLLNEITVPDSLNRNEWKKFMEGKDIPEMAFIIRKSGSDENKVVVLIKLGGTNVITDTYEKNEEGNFVNTTNPETQFTSVKALENDLIEKTSERGLGSSSNLRVFGSSSNLKDVEGGTSDEIEKKLKDAPDRSFIIRESGSKPGAVVVMIKLSQENVGSFTYEKNPQTGGYTFQGEEYPDFQSIYRIYSEIYKGPADYQQTPSGGVGALENNPIEKPWVRVYASSSNLKDVEGGTSDEIEKKLKDAPDRSFIIRESASKPGALVVMLKISQDNVNSFIYEKNPQTGGYSFPGGEYPDFQSIYKAYDDFYKDFYPSDITGTQARAPININEASPGTYLLQTNNFGGFELSIKNDEGNVENFTFNKTPSGDYILDLRGTFNEQGTFSRFELLPARDELVFKTPADIVRFAKDISAWTSLAAKTLPLEPENAIVRERSRFGNILSTKSTALQDAYNEKINANKVGTGVSKNVYIAAQAPLPSDYEGFWLTAFQNGGTIIDLTTFDDINRTDYGNPGIRQSDDGVYYPENLNESKRIGYLEVTLIQNQTKGTPPHDYTESTYTVENQYGVKRTVTRIHDPTWKDYSDTEIGHLDDLTRILDSIKGQPMVHCRAGVGRTGTLITASILKEMINSPDSRINADNLHEELTNLISQLRAQRSPDFVQQAAQLQLLIDYGHHLLEQR